MDEVRQPSKETERKLLSGWIQLCLKTCYSAFLNYLKVKKSPLGLGKFKIDSFTCNQRVMNNGVLRDGRGFTLRVEIFGKQNLVSSPFSHT